MTTPIDMNDLPRGAKPPIRDPRTIQVRDVLAWRWATPEVFDLSWYTGVAPQPYDTGNTEFGCCTVSAIAGLMRRFEQREAGAFTAPTREQVLDFYFAHTGGQDIGWYALEALKAWRKEGMPAKDGRRYHIDGFFAADPTDPAHIREAIYVFGGVYLVFGLPVGWNNVPRYDQSVLLKDGEGSIGSAGWHAVFCDSYNEVGCDVWFESWLMPYRHLVTWAAMAQYCTEVYAVADSWNRAQVAALLDLDRIPRLFEERGISQAVPA